MTAKIISPTQDTYGNLARASFFADYIEVLALRGHRNRRKLLKDLLGDNYPRSRRIIQTAAAGSDDWESEDLADDVWFCMRQRAQILGDEYPFVVDRNKVRLKADTKVRESKYIGLLALSMVHAFKLLPHLTAENLLEVIVADAIENRGLTVGRFGEIGRNSSHNFEAAIQKLSSEFGFAMDADAVTRRENAQDEGVDIVAHLDWGGQRAGRWVFIGQVTCARSDDWVTKLYEPVPDSWMAYLGEVSPPIPFLAVPYHVGDEIMDLFRVHRRHILDRLRVVLSLPAVSDDLRAQVDALLGASVQTFAVQ